MKVSVIGCGNIAQTHLNILSKMNNITISSVVDIDKTRADKTALQFNTKAYYDYIEMINDDSVDCVHICTPHYLHKEMTINCLEKGINVLCEKPAAISFDEIKEIRKAQNMSSASYGICFQNRYNESVKSAIKVKKSGKLGRLLAIRGSVLWCRNEDYYTGSWHGKKTLEGGGVLINQAIHTLDLMGLIMSESPIAVDAHIYNDHMKGVIDTEDSAVLRLEYKDGIVGILNATTSFSTDANAEISIYFEKGTVLISSLDAYIMYKDGEIEKLTSDDKKDIVGKAYWGSGHTYLIKDFYEKMERKEKFPLDAFSGGEVIRIIDAAYESAQSGKRIVI